MSGIHQYPWQDETLGRPVHRTARLTPSGEAAAHLP